MKTYLVIVADQHLLHFNEATIQADNPVQAMLQHEDIDNFYDLEGLVSSELAVEVYEDSVMEGVHTFWESHDLCVRAFEIS